MAAHKLRTMGDKVVSPTKLQNYDPTKVINYIMIIIIKSMYLAQS